MSLVSSFFGTQCIFGAAVSAVFEPYRTRFNISSCTSFDVFVFLANK